MWRLKRGVKWVLTLPFRWLAWTPIGRDIRQTAGTAAAFTWQQWFIQKGLGFNRDAYWPMHLSSIASSVRRIKIGIGTAPGLSPGCYIQGINGVEIGDYTIIAPNVGLISAGHAPGDLSRHEPAQRLKIGRYCWLGMNVVILPGVEIGDHTVVAAGAVVAKSFPDGYCVIGGVPARVLKTLDRGQVVEHRNPIEYIGFHALNGRSKADLFRSLGLEP